MLCKQDAKNGFGDSTGHNPLRPRDLNGMTLEDCDLAQG